MNKPCPTCPFLEANRGKPTPTGFKCEEYNEMDWYSEENISRVWNEMRKEPIIFLSCHSSDPHYFGNENAKEVHACAGASLLVYLHLQIFTFLATDGAGLKENYLRYLQTVGFEAAIEIITFGQKALAMMQGHTDSRWGNMTLPQHINIDLETIRWPAGHSKVKDFVYKHKDVLLQPLV